MSFYILLVLTSYTLCVDISYLRLNLLLISSAHTMVAYYEDILHRKSRETCTKRGTREEKNNIPTYKSQEKSLTPRLEVPKKHDVSRKLEALKWKGVIIGSPLQDKSPTPPAPVLGKEKEKMVEP